MTTMLAALLLGLVSSASFVAAEPEDVQEKARIEERLKALRTRYARVTVELNEKRRALARLEEALGVRDAAEIQADMTALSHRLDKLHDRRLDARVRKAQLRRELAEVRGLLDGRWFRPARLPAASVPEAEVRLGNDPRLKALAESLLKTEVEIDDIKRLAGPNPDLRTLDRLLAPAQARAEATRRRIEETRRELVPVAEQQLRDRARQELERQAAAQERLIRDAEEQDRVLEAEAESTKAELEGLRRAQRSAAQGDLLDLRDDVARLEHVRKAIADEITRLELLQPEK